MVLIDFIDDAVEAQEWTIDDADIVGFDEFDLLTGPRLPASTCFNNSSHFFIR